MGNRRKASRPTGPPPQTPADEFFLACVEMLGRTGATATQIRYSDDKQPVVWMVIAEYPGAEPQVQAALTPRLAAFRLLEDLLDGGRCRHCQKPTGVTEHFKGMPVPEAVCWYQFDPELKTFRRGCE